MKTMNQVRILLAGLLTAGASGGAAFAGPQSILCRNIPLPEVEDTQAPARPVARTADASHCRSVTLTWDGAYDAHSALKTYRIYQNGALAAETHGTPAFLHAKSREFHVTGLNNQTLYVFGVSAVDLYGNESVIDDFPAVTTLAADNDRCNDNTPPTAPSGLTTTPVPGTCRSLEISFPHDSTDDLSGIKEYILYRDGLKIAAITTGNYGAERFGLVPGATYAYWLTAVDRAGNESGPGPIVHHTVPSCDDAVPQGNLKALILAVNLPGRPLPSVTMGDIGLKAFGRAYLRPPTESYALEKSGGERSSFSSGRDEFMAPAIAQEAQPSLSSRNTILSPPNLRDFFHEVSYGKINLENAGIFGWIPLPGTIDDYCSRLNADGEGETCNMHEIKTAALQAAETFGFDPARPVDRTILVVNGQVRNEAGGNIVYLSDFDLGTAIHEVGHTFGIDHAASWLGRDFTGPVGAGRTLPLDFQDLPFGAHILAQYGDPYNRMGDLAIHHFSAFQKELMGVIRPSQVAHADGDGDYTLDQVEFPSFGTKALRIPIRTGGTGKAPFLVAEYRSGRGYNRTPDGSGAVFQGVQLRLVPERFSGVASDTVTIGELTAENPVFVDWHRDMRFTLVEINNEQAVIRICGLRDPFIPENALPAQRR